MTKTEKAKLAFTEIQGKLAGNTRAQALASKKTQKFYIDNTVEKAIHILQVESQLRQIMPWQEAICVNGSREIKKVLEDMAAGIDRIPALYETDGDDNAKCILHYFDTCGSADWYIFEVDFETGEAYGYATLTGDITDPDAEFGYIDLNSLCKMARINLDLHFAGISKNEIKRKKYGEPQKEVLPFEELQPEPPQAALVKEARRSAFLTTGLFGNQKRQFLADRA